MNPKVDTYLIDGCMRCKLGGTPACKVNKWRKELAYLRIIALGCGLTEELKWGVPCYTHLGKNILTVAAFKQFCAISFFKGTLLEDTANILSSPGENSQSFRRIECTDVRQIAEMEDIIREYIFQATSIEELGMKVVIQKSPQPVPEELLAKFEDLPALRQAFSALTPGRQRGYIMYFAQPKQSATRTARIEKYMQKIFNGEGLNDKYRN